MVLAGTVLLNGSQVRPAAEMACLSSEGQGLRVEENSDAKLLLAGEPIDEPVEGYAPFVLNSTEEIAESIAAFNRGDFGRM
ncbi:hypothetical protein D3H34_31555 [Acidovorax cavernicola]|uniref:Pirin C-terminal domain-containing protein n=1 Tax=Acidovorax cavernicola TaxID=1675792 RepID=A0A9X8GRX7_9BURK|nr:hypothetical protein D3H34_31555 [Acidovorax cavernicola]